jgi:hypothetical protein
VSKKTRAKEPSKRGRGRPEFEPTEEQKKLVDQLAGYGIPEPDIARLVINPATKEGISPVTLRKYFRDELDVGHVRANQQVAGALFKNATTGTETYPGGIPTAQIFWLKTRGKGQWRDKQVIELEKPPSEMEEAEVDQAIGRLLAKAAAKADKPDRKAKRGSH